MREQSKRATLQLVDMECSYLTVDFFRKLPQDVEKGGNPSHSIFDRYNDTYLRRIGRLCEALLLADLNYSPLSEFALPPVAFPSYASTSSTISSTSKLH
ncbi:hypothetical protein SLEP1_g58235 [Rubroshorea leprosula]|nr:hypothetical protein SLEP1_g58235 [Rubroshorea leprosula]